jgi:hypothetical protein
LIINSPNLSYLRIIDAISVNHTKWNISCHAENVHGKDEASSLLNIIPGKFWIYFSEAKIK